MAQIEVSYMGKTVGNTTLNDDTKLLIESPGSQSYLHIRTSTDANGVTHTPNSGLQIREGNENIRWVPLFACLSPKKKTQESQALFIDPNGVFSVNENVRFTLLD